MATKIQLRRGTAAEWTSANPTLSSGEAGFETDTGKFKIGNGSTSWNSLSYSSLTSSDVSSQINSAISNLIDSAPATLDTLNELAAAINDDANFFSTVSTNLSNHEADTTNIHGIADTSLLATTSSVDTAIGAHNSDTTSVHGISNTANIVYTDDSRLSDARTPTAHTHPTSDITNFTEDVQDVVGDMVSTNTESGISVSYDDETGKLNFNVNDPTITLSGDVTGSATMTDLGNVTITTSISSDSVALGTDTTGDYVATITGTADQVVVAGEGTESRAVTLSLPQSIATTSSPTFAGATLDSVRIGVTNVNEIDTSSGNLILDSAGGTVEVDDDLTIAGNLTVNGTTTTINATTISVDDKNIELGSVETPTDTTANGGGITLKGTTDKTFNWSDTTDSWTSSEHIDLASGKVLKINGTEVLSATEYTGNAATVTNGVVTTGSYSDPSWITSIGWSKVSTTPTTLSGYGITDAQPVDGDLTAIAALTGTSGFLKKTAEDTWSLDTNTYLTANQTITLSGDVSGSGTTSIEVTIADDSHNHIISNIDGLQTALDAKAPLASPLFTGTPAAPTAAQDTNTTQIATTEFVVGQAGSATPLADGTAAVGTSLRYARQDHRHATDTTRAPLASPDLTGTPTAPTAAVTTNNTQLATTAFARSAASGAGLSSTVTASRTLTSADIGYTLLVNSTSAITLTLDEASFTAVGARIDIVRMNTGTVTFAPAANHVVNSKDSKLQIDGRYAAATVIYLGSNTFLLVGSLA